MLKRSLSQPSLRLFTLTGRHLVSRTRVGPSCSCSSGSNSAWNSINNTIINSSITSNKVRYFSAKADENKTPKSESHSNNDQSKNGSNNGSNNGGQLRIDKPSYQLTFTCKKCDTRSSHNVTKQAYHHGTVLIQCPSCKNRHLIADHLKIFSDKRVTLEDILASKGENIVKGTLDINDLPSDLEWEDLPPQLLKDKSEQQK